MHTLICFEGTNYVGKTTIAKNVSAKIPAIYGPRVAMGWEKDTQKIHKNPNHFARFSFFMKEIAVRSSQICLMLKQSNIVLDRYLLSVFAYHNLIIGKRLEESTDISQIRHPDCTIFLTIDEETLKKRMEMRPPRHQYESNVCFLLDVQYEFLKLIDREKTIVVNTSAKTVEEIINEIISVLANRAIINS